MPDDSTNTKDRRTLFLMGVMILASAAIFAVSGDAPQTFLIAVAGLAGSLSMKAPLERTQRSFIYMGLAAFVITVLADQIMPVNPRRFFLMPAEVYCPAVILIGVAATYFDQRESNVTAVIALALVATMMAGNVVGQPDPGERLTLAPILFSRFHNFYAIVVSMQLAAMLLLLPRAPRHLSHGRGDRRYRLLRQAIVLGSVAITLWGVLELRQAALHYERRFQHTFVRLFQRYLYRRGRWVVFGDDVDLWRTVPHRRRGDKAVVLRARSSETPGYLRGRVFYTYHNGRWSSRADGNALAMNMPGARYSYSIFERNTQKKKDAEQTERAAELAIFPDRNFRSNVLLAPGDAYRFEAIADGLSNNRDGVLTPTNIELDVGYFIKRTAAGWDEAYQAPQLEREEVLQQYLAMPEALRQALEPIAREAFNNAKAQSTPEALIAHLVRFFHAEFAYELGIRMRKGREDPVIQFLKTIRKGHCELFAAASVLLLRSRGIPARYVTGFVCAEPHPAGDYWIARLEDAHAWAEAYLPDKQKWVTVESTPAAGIPQGEETLNMLKAPWDRLKMAWQTFWSLMKRGYIAEGIVATVKFIVLSMGRAALHPVGGPILLIALIFVLRYLRRQWKSRKASAYATLAPTRAELSASYAAALRKIGRLGIQAPEFATPLELAERIREHPSIERSETVAALLEEYVQLRYKAQPPTSDTVASFTQRFREAMKHLRKGR